MKKPMGLREIMREQEEENRLRVSGATNSRETEESVAVHPNYRGYEKNRGFCLIMLACQMDFDGFPMKINGQPFNSDLDDDSDDEDNGDYNIEGYKLDARAKFIEIIHYPSECIYEIAAALRKDGMKYGGRTDRYEKALVQFAHLRSQKPLHFVKLYDHITENRLYFATAHTSSFMVIFMGTDLTRPFKRAIEKCKEDGLCSYSTTRTARARQHGFHCNTCFPEEELMVVCEACANKCHRGHDVYVVVNKDGVFEKKQMFCDCGDVLNCQCLPENFEH